MNAIETFEHNGKIIEIHQDEDARSPREDCGNLDVMVCLHKRYNLGDKHDYKFDNFKSWDELKDQIIKDHDPIAIQPLYLYDHSGITISTSPFSCPWDSGQVGFIFIPRKAMLKEWSMKHTSKKLVAKAESFIKGSVECYDKYISGETYGYIIKEKDRKEGDNCWGFYGIESVRAEAKAVA